MNNLQHHTALIKTGILITIFSQSQWPRCLRRGYAAARLLGLRFRFPPGHGCISLVIVVRVIRQRLLWRADHSSRGVLPILVFLNEC